MRAAEAAWCATLAAIVAWECTAPVDELLSDGCDRTTARHPIVVRAAIIITAAHLLRIIPRRLDPFTQTFGALSAVRRPASTR
ncbi:DUF7427 family protein [Nocardia niwae]|uniref:DUF7427 family protein n=1 Tax=Nocardia niwae TaxID=626084 RepID=UPI000A9518FD